MSGEASWFRLFSAPGASLCDEERPENTLRIYSSCTSGPTDLVRYAGASANALILSETAVAVFSGFRLPTHRTRACVLRLHDKPAGRYLRYEMQPTTLDLRFVDYSRSRFFSVTARGIRNYRDLNSAEDHERIVAEISRGNALRPILERERLDCERITFLPQASPALDLFIAPDMELCFQVRRELKEAIERAGLTGFAFGSRSRLYLC